MATDNGENLTGGKGIWRVSHEEWLSWRTLNPKKRQLSGDTVVVFTHLKDCLKTFHPSNVFLSICYVPGTTPGAKDRQRKPELLSDFLKFPDQWKKCVCCSRKQSSGRWKASGRTRALDKEAPLVRGLQLCKGVHRWKRPGCPGLSRTG